MGRQNLKQKGYGLVEVLAGLLIVGLVVSGVLSLYNSAEGTRKSNQMQNDLAGVRAAVKGLYAGIGTFGTSNLNGVLKASNKLPTTWLTDASTPPIITHQLNGNATVAGASGGTAYTVTITNIPTDVCTTLLANSSSGWTSIKVGTASAITAFPIDPDTASNATNCGASTANMIVFTGN